MKPQRRRRKKKPARRPLPKDFICIAPDEAGHVFDVINGSAQEHEKEIAKLHFHLCLHCQEAVARLHLIEESLSDDAKELLHHVSYSDSTVTAGGTKTLCARADQ